MSDLSLQYFSLLFHIRGGGHSISKLPYVRPKIWLSKLNPYSAVQNGEFHTLRVHFNNEKQPLQCTNNFFLLGQLQEDKKILAMLSFITCLLLMISLNICISISNGIPTLTVQISMKTDPYSALDKPQKHTLRGRTSGRSFTLSVPRE